VFLVFRLLGAQLLLLLLLLPGAAVREQLGPPHVFLSFLPRQLFLSQSFYSHFPEDQCKAWLVLWQLNRDVKHTMRELDGDLTHARFVDIFILFLA
jgi:hypothetical protein